MTNIRAHNTRGISKRILQSLLLAILAISSVNCRTSQQARRGNNQAANRQAGGSAGQPTRMMDSLVMIQEKLIQVIDTMSDVLERDHIRIRNLELEIARLKSLLESQGSLYQPQSPNGAYGAPSGYTSGYPMPPSGSAQVSQGAMMAPPMSNNSAASPVSSGPSSLNAVPSSTPIPSNIAPPAPSGYYAALKLFNQGKYQDALTRFDELRQSDPQSYYSPNYEYWKGESQYALGHYEQAIVSFHTVLQQYPNSTKADDAEFKIGEAYEKLGNTQAAKAAYQRLLLSSPQSEYRSRAEAKLNHLK